MTPCRPPFHSRRHGGAPAGAGLAALVLVVVAGLSGAPALAASCPGQDRPVEVTLETRFDPARVNHSLSRDRIQAMFTQTNGPASIQGNSQAVGLTRTRSEFRFRTRTEMYTLGNGQVCVYLRGVEGELNQLETVIYVAREYPRGGCNYNVIYEHEKIHVGVYFFTQKTYAERLRRRITELTRRVNPRVARTQEAGRTLHAQIIEAGVADLLAGLEAERNRQNAALDSPGNYARERAKCPTW